MEDRGSFLHYQTKLRRSVNELYAKSIIWMVDGREVERAMRVQIEMRSMCEGTVTRVSRFGYFSS